ncbi:hypothetical protein [Actinoplanes philippinensis]|uniref:hypothetical protein n=1 Tax=Actinoplanes philippinensis TaxID=35752 RepID=UPI00340CA42D
MTAIEEIATAYAVAFGLDPDDLIARVHAQRDRRIERGKLPAKRCPGCQLDKPALAFAEDSRSADGLQARCRSCDVSRARKRRRVT